MIALEAFLALHDLTGEPRWLVAAEQAADYAETWVYCWNVPLSADNESVYPRGAATTGFSLIACGHSGADLFMAIAPFPFYRLYLKTGDPHYADMARQLLYNPRQSVDHLGELGYGHPGLCTEAVSLAPPRGHGVDAWLPWLSFNMIEPLVRLRDTYGFMDAHTAFGPELSELRRSDQAFARRRGLLTIEN